MGSGGTAWDALDILTKERLNQKTVYISSSAPATTYSGMLWYDTTENKLKKRNAANDTWNYEIISATYTIFKSGSTYYALDENGNIAYSSVVSANAVIQSCVTAMTAGGKILIKKGRYYFDDSVTIAGEGICIEGESTGYDTFGTTLEITVINKPVFKYDAAGHKFFGSIKNMAIQGENNTGSVAINIVKGFSDLWFERLFIKNFATAGIKIEANGSKVWNIWILDCLIEDGTGYGVYMTNAPDKIDRVTIRGGHYYGNTNTVRIDHAEVHNVLITDITAEQEKQTSIYLAGGRNVLITNNRIFDCGTAAANTYDGVYIAGSSPNPAINAVITGNRIGNHWTSNQRYNINLGGDCDHVTIRANNLLGYGTAAILKNTTGTDLDIVGNRGWADTKEIFFPVTYATNGLAQWDGHPVANIDTTNEVASIGVVLPADFKSIQSVEFVYIALETAASQYIDINTYWGKVGEQRNFHSNAATINLGATVSGQIMSYNVSSLTVVVEAGDFIGYYCAFNATVIDTNINVLGIRIKYEPIEN